MHYINLTFGEDKSITVSYGDEMVLFIDTLTKIQKKMISVDLTNDQYKIVRKAGYTIEAFWVYIFQRINTRHLEKGSYCLLSAAVRRSYDLDEKDPRWESLIARIEAEYFLQEVKVQQQTRELAGKMKPSIKHNTCLIR